MSDVPEQQTQAPAQPVALRQERQVRVVEDVVSIFDTAKFEHFQRIAGVLACASIFPAHLKGYYEGGGRSKVWVSFTQQQVTANAVVIVNQADRWRTDPFALAQCTYATPDGKIGYEGKMIAAVVQKLARVTLHYRWWGEGLDRSIMVSDMPYNDDGTSPRGARNLPSPGTVAGWATFTKAWEDRNDPNNSKPAKMKDNWASQPDMQLAYRGARVWANLYEPGIVVGVLSDEDLEGLEDRRIETVQDEAPKAVRRTRRMSAGFGSDDASSGPGAAPTPQGDVIDAEFVDQATGEVSDGGKAVSDNQAAADADQAAHQAKTEAAEAAATKAAAAQADAEARSDFGESASAESEAIARHSGGGGTGLAQPRQTIGVHGGEAIPPAEAATAGIYFHVASDKINAAGQRPFYDEDGRRRGFGEEKHGIRVATDISGATTTTWSPPAKAEPTQSQAAPPVDDAPPFDDDGGGVETDPWATFHQVVVSSTSWPPIRQAMSTLARDPVWAADAESKAAARLKAWAKAKAMGIQPAVDSTAFQCFLAVCEDRAEIQKQFENAIRESWYTSAAVEIQNSVARAVMQRTRSLPE